MGPTVGWNSSCPHCEGYEGWRDKIRAASNKVKTIGGLIEGKLYAEHLSGAALQQGIDLFHPDSNDMDLPPPQNNDPYAEPLQITLDLLRQHLYGLSFDTAAGNTGWTNSLLYALYNGWCCQVVA